MSNKITGNDDLIFQVTDWDYYHTDDVDADDKPIKKFIARMYGTTIDDEKIFVEVEGFHPYFYVEIPSNWNKFDVEEFVETVRRMAFFGARNELHSWEIEKKHIFHGFTNYKLFNFVKLIFHSYDGFRAFRNVFYKVIDTRRLGVSPRKFKLYESNIEPILRLMHIRNIQACGWIKCDGGKYNVVRGSEPSHNSINITINWEELHHYENKTIAPLIIAAFDIECTSGDGQFPQPHRDADKVIQIGTTFNRYGETECYYKHIITLGSCDPIECVDVESYNDEVEVLIAWTRLITRMNPDVITGYNIFGFDYNYLEQRAEKLMCHARFTRFSRVTTESSPFVEKELSSSALGDNTMRFYHMHGRVQVDMMKDIQRNFKLSSYKLDSVASEFIRETIKSVQHTDAGTVIETQNTYGMDIGRFIKFYFNDGLSDNAYKNESKFKVIAMTDKTLTIKETLEGEVLELQKYKVYWCQAKDDVSPHDIFRLQEGTSADRAIIAKYCIQDCVLCNKLMAKLQVITNNVGMANVCNVPLSYIFMRGQGVKILSLVSKKCRERNHLIPIQNKKYVPPSDKNKNEPKKKPRPGDHGYNPNNDTRGRYRDILEKNADDDEEIDLDGYEGATVFPPISGVHFEPVAVLDYASLYPSSMIFRNISHECLVLDKKYDHLPGYRYEQVTYRNNDGTEKTCRYAICKKGRVGILAEILKELLQARKDTRKLIEKELDVFKKKILDGLQLAYKITANSLYGQTGAKTSAIYLRDIAASTTATGREMLEAARRFCIKIFPKLVETILVGDIPLYEKRIQQLFSTQKCVGQSMFIGYELVDDSRFKNNDRQAFIDNFALEIAELLQGKIINPECVYGDTDSVFINFHIADKIVKEPITTHEGLRIAIKLGILCGDVINHILPPPQNLEYEKTFWPFIILTKKRYVGNKYEFNPDAYSQTSMGIVLKRRDNAPIVKIVVGGIVRSILNERSPEKAIAFSRETLRNMLSGNYQIDKFIISKTLKDKDKYADWTKMVHAVLADRVEQRDPGNGFRSNDRVPYVYVETDHEVKLQGDRVELPDYIQKHDIKIDYLFYITNQIMKPSIQFLDNVVVNPKKIFDAYINREINRRKGKRPIDYYFKMDQYEDDSDSDSESHHVISVNILDESSDESPPMPSKSKAKPKPKVQVIARKKVSFTPNNELDDDSSDGEIIELPKVKAKPKPKTKKAIDINKLMNAQQEDDLGFVLDL